MRAAALLSCTVLLVACGGAQETPPADSAAVAPAPAPAATISLADLAGNWTQTVRTETSDSVLVTAAVTATSDTTGWTITLPGRPVMPVRVLRVDGDSIVTATGPYESVLRKGVQVTTENVLRMQDGKLVGITVARYQGAGADSVVRLRTELTRAP